MELDEQTGIIEASARETLARRVFGAQRLGFLDDFLFQLFCKCQRARAVRPVGNNEAW